MPTIPTTLIIIIIISILNPFITTSFIIPPFHTLISTTSTSFPTKLSNIHDAEEDTAMELPSFESKEEYETYLKSKSKLPQGFAVGMSEGKFVPEEAPNMGLLNIRGTLIYVTDDDDDSGGGGSWSAVFTKNKFPGSPVIIGKKRLQQTPKPQLKAIFINNKVSNVCTASSDGGISDSESICTALFKHLDLSSPSSVLPCSTGVIGWKLPIETLINEVIPKVVSEVNGGGEEEEERTAFDAAFGIMTTDRYPKMRSLSLSNGGRIVGIVKGAGMIEPNMATMLCYILTDLNFNDDDTYLQSTLTRTVDQTFNSISVDGDESTSDTVVLCSSDRVSVVDEKTIKEEFEKGLMEICTGLASDLVRNGEGTKHVIRVQVRNFPGGDDFDARCLGRHLVNSPLVKCAVSGNDPNTGRIIGAIGSYLGKFHPTVHSENMTLTLGNTIIFQNGKFVLGGDEQERILSRHMKDAELGEVDDFPRHQKFVEIGVDFGDEEESGGCATVLGSDLTSEYVSINADYRS